MQDKPTVRLSNPELRLRLIWTTAAGTVTGTVLESLTDAGQYVYGQPVVGEYSSAFPVLEWTRRKRSCCSQRCARSQNGGEGAAAVSAEGPVFLSTMVHVVDATIAAEQGNPPGMNLRRFVPSLCAIAVIAVLAATANCMVFGSLAPLHQFPYYSTCDQYTAKTSKPCPAFDPAYPVKSWVDPNPPAPDEDGMVTYLGIALAKDGKTPLVKDGKPYLKPFKIPAELAGRVNIAFKTTSPSDNRVDTPNPKGEYQMPLRELQGAEQLGFGFGGIPIVQAAITMSSGGPVATGPLSSSADAAIQKLADLIEVLSAKLDLLIATAK